MASINELPENLILDIFKNLSMKDLSAASGVCRQWRRISADRALWRHVNLRSFNIDLLRLKRFARAYLSDSLQSLEITSCYTEDNSNNIEMDYMSRKIIGYDMPVKIIQRDYPSASFFSIVQKRCPRLHRLYLDSLHLSCRVPLTSLPASVQSLTLTHSTLVGDWFKSLSTLNAGEQPCSVLPHLTELDLAYSNITDTDIGHICRGWPRLNVLKLTNCRRVDPQGLRSVAACLHDLKVLSIDNSGCDDDSLRQLSQLVNLTELTYNGCQDTTCEGLRYIAEGLQQLRVLELDDTDCDDIGLRAISRLKYLTELSINYCEITKEGLKWIARGACKLERLFMDSTECDDEVINLLCQNHRGSLRRLNVSSCRHITDQAIAVITTTLSRLEWLDVSRCDAISQAAIFSLVELKNLRHLSVGDLDFFNKDTHAQLQTLMPECKIYPTLFCD